MGTRDHVNRTRPRWPALLWLFVLMLGEALVLSREPSKAVALPSLFVIEIDAELELPADAAIADVDAAVRYAREIVIGELRAEHPRVTSVQLLTLTGALAASMDASPGTETLLDVDYPGVDPATAVWRVEFDSARFAVSSCPPPDPEAPEHDSGNYPCGYGDRAIITVFAETGRLVELMIPAPIHD